jgi:hypothetical protein
MGTFWRLLKTLGWIFVGFLGSFVPLVAANWYATYQYPVAIRWGAEVNTGAWDNGYVSAFGTWTIENTKSGIPLQVSKIACHRSDRVCTVSQAEIIFGILSVEADRIPITDWTSSTVTFASDALCTRHVYTIDRTNMRAIGTRTLKEPQSPECSSFYVEKQLSLTLRDGSKVVQELREAELSRAMPFAIGAIALWDAFVIFRIVRVWRRPRRIAFSPQPSY